MDIELSSNEARGLWFLIEKATNTHDCYPLPLCTLERACNQKSTREPVLNLSESEVMETLDGLISHQLAAEETPVGAQVTTYAHRSSNTLGLTCSFIENELGICLC